MIHKQTTPASRTGSRSCEFCGKEGLTERTKLNHMCPAFAFVKLKTVSERQKNNRRESMAKEQQANELTSSKQKTVKTANEQKVSKKETKMGDKKTLIIHQEAQNLIRDAVAHGPQSRPINVTLIGHTSLPILAKAKEP